jgi:hypothetical protein
VKQVAALVHVLQDSREKSLLLSSSGSSRFEVPVQGKSQRRSRWRCWSTSCKRRAAAAGAAAAAAGTSAAAGCQRQTTRSYSSLQAARSHLVVLVRAAVVHLRVVVHQLQVTRLQPEVQRNTVRNLPAAGAADETKYTGQPLSLGGF